MNLAGELRDWRDAVQDAERALGAELRSRMDRELNWTLRAGKTTVSAPTPQPQYEWDLEALERLLDELVEEGTLEPAARTSVLGQKIETVLRQRGLNQLLKRPDVAPRLLELRTEVPKNRPVKVTVR